MTLLPKSKAFQCARWAFNVIGISPGRFQFFNLLKQWIIFHGHETLDPHHVAVIKKYVKENMVVIDAGANCGDYTKEFLKCGAVVHAFEPSRIFGKLYKRFGSDKRVFLYPIALGSRNEEITLNEFQNDRLATAVSSTYGGKVVRERHVQCKTIDRLNISSHFIKIDCEGMDYEILKGAKKSLQRDRPVVLAEYNPLAMDRGYTEKRMVGFMESIGYMHKIIERSTYSTVTDILFVPTEER